VEIGQDLDYQPLIVLDDWIDACPGCGRGSRSSVGESIRRRTGFDNGVHQANDGGMVLMGGYVSLVCSR